MRAGQSVDPGAVVPTRGTRQEEVVDGLSNTVLISEGVVPRYSGFAGAIGELYYGNMGGPLFSASLTPNSSSPDRPVGPCPRDAGDTQYAPPCLTYGGYGWGKPSAAGSQAAARSRHAGGVTTAMADGSVAFVSDSMDVKVWRSLATRAGGEVVQMPF